MTITIENVPDGCENAVRYYADMAIKAFQNKQRSDVIPQDIIKKIQEKNANIKTKSNSNSTGNSSC